MNYQDYLNSYDWQVKKTAALKRAAYRCQVCNAQENLEVHHRTYQNFGSEQPEDLTVLCARCHDAVNEFMPRKPYYWLSMLGINIEDVIHD